MAPIFWEPLYVERILESLSWGLLRITAYVACVCGSFLGPQEFRGDAS